jgi:hypothetical protein
MTDSRSGMPALCAELNLRSDSPSQKMSAEIKFLAALEPPAARRMSAAPGEIVSPALTPRGPVRNSAPAPKCCASAGFVGRHCVAVGVVEPRRIFADIQRCHGSK